MVHVSSYDIFSKAYTQLYTAKHTLQKVNLLDDSWSYDNIKLEALHVSGYVYHCLINLSIPITRKKTLPHVKVDILYAIIKEVN